MERLIMKRNEKKWTTGTGNGNGVGDGIDRDSFVEGYDGF